MLYLVATPIGNLSDMTLRAIETLKQADFIIAENPRQSLKLLNHYEIPKKEIKQFSEPNEQRILPSLISYLKTRNGALITDAGTPGVSDPGFRLVRECIKENIGVVSIPGPSAVITALAASGLPTDRFLFFGFLQKTEAKVMKALNLIKETEATGIVFESPFRIKKTMEIIAKNFPEANVVIARELTKIHEEFIRGKASEVLTELNKKNNIRGEIVLLVSFK